MFIVSFTLLLSSDPWTFQLHKGLLSAYQFHQSERMSKDRVSYLLPNSKICNRDIATRSLYLSLKGSKKVGSLHKHDPTNDLLTTSTLIAGPDMHHYTRGANDTPRLTFFHLTYVKPGLEDKFIQQSSFTFQISPRC